MREWFEPRRLVGECGGWKKLDRGQGRKVDVTKASALRQLLSGYGFWMEEEIIDGIKAEVRTRIILCLLSGFGEHQGGFREDRVRV